MELNERLVKHKIFGASMMVGSSTLQITPHDAELLKNTQLSKVIYEINTLFMVPRDRKLGIDRSLLKLFFGDKIPCVITKEVLSQRLRQVKREEQYGRDRPSPSSDLAFNEKMEIDREKQARYKVRDELFRKAYPDLVGPSTEDCAIALLQTLSEPEPVNQRSIGTFFVQYSEVFLSIRVVSSRQYVVDSARVIFSSGANLSNPLKRKRSSRETYTKRKIRQIGVFRQPILFPGYRRKCCRGFAHAQIGGKICTFSFNRRKRNLLTHEYRLNRWRDKKTNVLSARSPRSDEVVKLKPIFLSCSRTDEFDFRKNKNLTSSRRRRRRMNNLHKRKKGNPVEVQRKMVVGGKVLTVSLLLNITSK